MFSRAGSRVLWASRLKPPPISGIDSTMGFNQIDYELFLEECAEYLWVLQEKRRVSCSQKAKPMQ